MSDETLARLRKLTARLTEDVCEPGSVLIVEDDDDCRKVLVDILTKHGYNVVSVSGCTAAMEAITNWKPALALIDLRLPGLNGIGVGKAVRAQSPKTRVVILTAYSTQSAAIAAINARFNGWLQKPYKIVDLLAILETYQ